MSVPNTEWLEADGLGGFASGTASGLRSRRYHGLLVTAMTPPTGRVVLVNGVEAWIESDGRRYAITSQRYAPDVVHPDGLRRLESFANTDWARWTLRLGDGTAVDHEVIVRQGAPITSSSCLPLDALLTRRGRSPARGAWSPRPSPPQPSRPPPA